MKIFYIILLFLIISCEHEVILDNDKIYCDNGIYRNIETQVPITGKSIYYYENGKKSVEYNYLNGLNHGKEIRWDDKGSIVYEWNFKHSQRHGSWASYYSNGKIKNQMNYYLDIENGEWTEYYDNERLKSKGYYEFRIDDLKLRKKEHSDTTTVEDTLIGLTMLKISVTEYYKEKNGVWEYWDSLGNLTHRIEYVDGVEK